MIISLPDALDRAAAQYPDKEAVRCNGQSLTYAELQRQANSLAHHLIEQGVQRGDRIGLYMNKDVEAVVAVYGIMKAGAAYVPLDPFAPVARLSFVLADCDIRILITKENKLNQVRQMISQTDLTCLVGVSAQANLPTRCIPWEAVVNNLVGKAQPPIHVLGQDLAYILYTSGSTGTPKGIMHTHQSALSFAQWAAREYGLHVKDRVSNHAPFHFDLSTFDLYATVLAGGTMVIIPEMATKFPARLSQLMAEERISVWYSVPFALIQLLDRGCLAAHKLPALRWILFAGEPFPTKHLRRLMNRIPQARYSNLYGPTETNVCTYYHVDALPFDSDAPIPIGRPCTNIETLVLDDNDMPVSVGQVGELVVRGGVVMSGYWGKPDLNAECFFHRLVADQVEGRFYRTGDLVRMQPDGNYQYLGRKDRQVKTRGYRVELDEIEVALLAHQDVQEAAVYTITDCQENSLIVGAVVSRPGSTLTQRTLGQHLAATLPPYAVPTSIHILNAFPRTTTGKINRRALQTLAINAA